MPAGGFRFTSYSQALRPLGPSGPRTAWPSVSEERGPECGRKGRAGRGQSDRCGSAVLAPCPSLPLELATRPPADHLHADRRRSASGLECLRIRFGMGDFRRRTDPPRAFRRPSRDTDHRFITDPPVMEPTTVEHPNRFGTVLALARDHHRFSPFLDRSWPDRGGMLRFQWATRSDQRRTVVRTNVRTA